MIAAIVVLYHPKRNELERLQSSLIGQVDTVFMIDNTPGSSLPGPDFIRDFVTYIPMGKNKGIGEAHNIGIKLSIDGGYSHVLLLDQDSAPSPDMVRKLLAAENELLNKGLRVAAMTPQIVDERTGPRPTAVRYRSLGFLSVKKIYRDQNATQPEQTDIFIASGSLIRTEAFRILGMMRSDFFMDCVDTEWALRAHVAGFRSFCVPNATLNHTFGDAAKTIFGRDVYVYNDLRYYYRMRNFTYLLRLATMGLRWRAYNLARLPYFFLEYSLFSSNRLKTICLLLKAFRDGWSGKLGPYSIPAN